MTEALTINDVVFDISHLENLSFPVEGIELDSGKVVNADITVNVSEHVYTKGLTDHRDDGRMANNPELVTLASENKSNNIQHRVFCKRNGA